jgi:hypothetical protein
MVAILLAVMGGSGFMYYRMNGGYKPEETLEAAKDTVDDAAKQSDDAA